MGSSPSESALPRQIGLESNSMGLFGLLKCLSRGVNKNVLNGRTSPFICEIFRFAEKLDSEKRGNLRK